MRKVCCTTIFLAFLPVMIYGQGDTPGKSDSSCACAKSALDTSRILGPISDSVTQKETVA
jgi:hypothetical protein